MADAPLLVSVIVPVRNSPAGISRLLAAVAAQSLPAAAYEVLVVDDASTDSTADTVRRAGLARLLQTPRRSGAYVARNLALGSARGATVAFTDADCRPAADWLERGLAALDSTGADLAGGRIQVDLSERPTHAELIDFSFLDQERMVAGGDAATANLFVRREVFDTIGSFNPRLVAGGDTEFTRRALAAGFRMVYAADACVEHPPRRRARDVVRKTFRMGIGRTQLAHHAAPGTWHRRPLWTYPGAWVPGTFLRLPGSARRLQGLERLQARGYRPSRRELRRLELLEWAFKQLPMVIGGLVESVRSLRRH